MALWSLIGDAGETYDLTNIGTLFAFMLVCIGVLVLRVQGARAAASVPRAVRVAGVRCCRRAGCVFVMEGLPRQAWERFGIWLVHRAGALLRLRLSSTAELRRRAGSLTG